MTGLSDPVSSDAGEGTDSVHAPGTASGGRDAVLIPTGREMKSYGCMRSLSQHGLHTVVASEAGKIPHFASRYCDEPREIPPFREDLIAYRNALLDLASRRDVKTIVPVRECDVYLLARYREAFAERVSVVAPRMDTLERAHDRLQLAREAEAAGVPYAETRLLSEAPSWDRDRVVKARYNILTDRYVEDLDPADATEVHDVVLLPADEPADEAALTDRMQHDPIVQEYIPKADKHLYCALWEDGEPLATYQHRQIRNTSWIGGAGIYRNSAYSQAVEDAAYDLLSHLEWEGYVCIEYLLDADTGEWKFLEINPRVWQSLPEAVRVGVDFPYHYWLAVQGFSDLVEDDYETGIRSHVSYGELKHLLSVRRDESPFEEAPSFSLTFAAIVASCLRYPRFDYLRLDDLPFFLHAMQSLTGVTVGDHYDAN